MSRGDIPSGGFSVRGVAREVLSAYRAQFGLLIALAVAVFIPAGLAEAFAHQFVDADADEIAGVSVAGAIAGSAAVTLTSTLGDLFYTGVVTAVVGEHRSGSRQSIAQLARELPYVRLLGVDVLFTLAVAFGLLLLIVPGIIFFTWFALAAPLVEIEGRSVIAAGRRSRELVRGHFWKVLAILGPTLIAGDLLAELIQTHGPDVLGDGFVEDWITSVIAEAITAPFFALAAVVTTHHLISGPAET